MFERERVERLEACGNDDTPVDRSDIMIDNSLRATDAPSVTQRQVEIVFL
jgi:hypothetical protein